MLKQENITIGSDPELFLFNKEEAVPSVGLLGGSKDAPVPVKFGAIQEDNVLAEFNIEPATTRDEFVHNIDQVMRQLRDRVSPLSLRVISSHNFAKEVLKKAGPQAMTFGCDPDFNAWTQEHNEPPSPYTTLRSAGGHVHVGYDVFEGPGPFEVVQAMDVYLGIPSVLLDDDTQRRSLYGKAGACRPKPYGVEYRTLSNFWLRSNRLVRWVYDNSLLAYSMSDEMEDILATFPGDYIQDVINNSKSKEAMEMVHALNIPMPE